MVIDDELIICHLIEHLIDCDELGVSLLPSTTSSQEGFERALKERPDIIITDINMPIMDGLELIHRLTEAGLKDTTYIIISGYQSFDYAYSAIKYGVTDFLLKPIDGDELNNTLRRIVEKSGSDHLTLQAYRSVSQRAEASRAAVRRQAMLNIQGANSDNREQVLDVFLNRDYFSFDEGLFRLGIFRLDLHTGADRLADRLLPTIWSRITDVIRPRCNDLEGVFLGNSLLFLLNYPEDAQQAVLDGLQVVLREALEQARDFRLSLAVGLSNPKRDIKSLQAAYREAYGAIQSRFVLGTNRLIEASEINLSPAAAFSAFGTHREAIRHSIDVLDRQLLDAAIRALLEDMHAYLAQYQSLTFSLYTQVLRKSLALMPEQKAVGADDRVDTGAATGCFENCFSLRDYDAAFERALSDTFDQLQQTSQSTQNQSIALIKRYIDEHYAAPLTLEHLADMVHFNAAYLGILFKKCEGIGISDYIVQKRIEKAKEMLRSRDRSIAQISNAVGYRDVRYFSKLFFQRIGIKPSEYRKIHSI